MNLFVAWSNYARENQWIQSSSESCWYMSKTSLYFFISWLTTWLWDSVCVTMYEPWASETSRRKRPHYNVMACEITIKSIVLSKRLLQQTARKHQSCDSLALSKGNLTAPVIPFIKAMSNHHVDLTLVILCDRYFIYVAAIKQTMLETGWEVGNPVTSFSWAGFPCADDNALCDVYTELPRDFRLTYDQKMAKLAVTRELVGKVVCSSYVTRQKVISYSWILAITRAYSPLQSTSSTIAFNRQKRSWNLSI